MSNIVFLNMNAATAGAVTAARPELKKLKTEQTKVYCRKLGNLGDPDVQSLSDGELNGATVIGFNVPTNIAAKSKKVIEIPLASSFPRKKLGDKLEESEMELLSKALAEYVRIPLKAYITTTASILDESAGAEDEVDF